jgi:acyl carrier protein
LFFAKKRLATIRFWPDTEPMEIPQKLKEYVDNNRGSLPPITDPDEPLQIDSLGLIRLVAFLESELGYRVEDEELIAENFATLRKLGELLATKTPTAPAAEAKPPTQEGIPTFSAKRNDT